MNISKTLLISLMSLTFPLVSMSEPAISHPDSRAGDYSGRSVALDGNTLMSGAPASPHRPPGTTANEGRVYPYTFDGSTWVPQNKVLPLDSASRDHFGYAVDIDESLAVVGAPNALDIVRTGPSLGEPPFSLIHGAAYILQSDGADWTQVQELSPSRFHPYRDFGAAVAVSDTTIAVGSPVSSHYGDDSGPLGGVYIYAEGPTGWGQEAYIEAEPKFGASFGHAVALHNDVLAVGIPYYDPDFVFGAVAIYRRIAGSWVQEEVLYGDFYFDYFGVALAIQDNTLVVGASPLEETYEGRFAVFEYDQTRRDWNLSDVILPPEDAYSRPHAGVFGDFGRSVSIDNGVIAVGMNVAKWSHLWGGPEGGPYTGPDDFRGELGALAYRQHPVSEEWVLVDRLVADDAEFFSRFGSSVDVSGDCVAVGADERDGAAGENEGGSYVFCDIAEVQSDYPLAMINVICCDIPFEPYGPYRYSLELLTSKSVESHLVNLRVDLESPKGKVTNLENSEVQLGLEGETLKLDGTVDLGKKSSPGTYKLSVTMTKNSGNAITRHAYFNVK